MPKVPLAVKIAVPIIGLLLTIGVTITAVGILKAWWSTPFSPVQPTGTQPIAFRHDLHITAKIDCQFCHRNVTLTEAATLPSVEQCYFCHQVVLKDSPEISKIAYAFQNGEPINWVRVHRLPDHVQFVHDSHVRFFAEQNGVAPSAACSICHGDVGSMKIAEQVRNLKMRDCVDCHRNRYLTYLVPDAAQRIRTAVVEGQRLPPPTDCAACHY